MAGDQMKSRHHERYEADPTPSREVVISYREGVFDEEKDASLALVHYRGGEEEFRLGCEYCSSDDAGDRAVGVGILAQLGWGDRTFLADSVRILIPFLGDSDDRVVCRAAMALGHRQDESAIPALLRLVDHPNPSVRYGVVFGLTGHADQSAIAALITLTTDEDFDVRNWAVFGLGSQTDADSWEIRDALREALSDEDHEVRGEALVGLARRGDKTIVPELLKEWKDDDVSLLSLEAAEEIKDSRLFHRLTQFTEILSIDEDPYFAKRLADAIAACRPASI